MAPGFKFVQRIREWANRVKLRPGSTQSRPDSFLVRYTTGQQQANRAKSADSTSTGDTPGKATAAEAEAKKKKAKQDKPVEKKSDVPVKPQFWRIYVVDPSSNLYYYWLLVISTAILYNVLMVIARSVFWKLHYGGMLKIWMTFDYICDIIYCMDMAVQFRTAYLEHGLVVTDTKKLKRYYMKKSDFILDIISHDVCQ